MAKDFFPVLSTLVAPIFPEPIFLTSFFINIFVISNPNGIEPKIYEYNETINISKFTVG